MTGPIWKESHWVTSRLCILTHGNVRANSAFSRLALKRERDQRSNASSLSWRHFSSSSIRFFHEKRISSFSFHLNLTDHVISHLFIGFRFASRTVSTPKFCGTQETWDLFIWLSSRRARDMSKSGTVLCTSSEDCYCQAVCQCTGDTRPFNCFTRFAHKSPRLHWYDYAFLVSNSLGLFPNREFLRRDREVYQSWHTSFCNRLHLRYRNFAPYAATGDSFRFTRGMWAT